MKSLRLYILALCLASVFTLSAGAQDLSIWPVRTLQSAATGTGNGTAIESAATGAVSVQITGTFSATVTFEGSIDGSNWIALMATNANDDSRATTATAAGIYSVVLNGSTSFRARISTYASGSVTVKARLTSGSVVKLGGGGGGAPSGAAGGSLDGTYPNPGIAASVAGAGLAESSNVLAVNVDDSTVEINTDTLRVKDAGVTNAKLAGSIAASKLVGTDIATVGTITAGVWNGTAVGAQYGGTGINTSASTGYPSLSAGTWSIVNATTLTAALNAMVGDSGSGGTKGLVPAPAAGDAAAGKFLKADGTWTAVAAGGMSIGGTVTSGTTGSVLFVGAGPVLSQDNSNLFWDNTNDRLGIGITAPTAPLTFSTATGEKIRFFDNGSGQYGIGLQANLLQIYANTSTRVGIGTGSSASFTETLSVTGSMVGIGKTNPSIALSFAASTGDKIALYDGGVGSSYGFGIQASQLQIITPTSGTKTSIGYGSSASFTELFKVDGTNATSVVPVVVSSASAVAFESGPNGGTNPVFRLVNSTSSQADGVSVTGLAAGSGTTLTALSSGSNSYLTFTPKGTGVNNFTSNSNGEALRLGSNTTFYVNDGGAGPSIVFSKNASRVTPLISFQTRANLGVVVLPGDGMLGFGSWTATFAEGTDSGFVRAASGVLRVNNGATSGTPNTAAGSLIVGTSTGAIGSSGAGVLAFALSTAPTTSPADTVQMYSGDAAAADHNLYTRNEAGEVNRLTGLAARVSTQFDKTSDTTLANVTGLTRNVEAGRTYAFTAVLYTTSNTSGGVKAAIAGTATATSIIYEAQTIDGSTVATVGTARATALGTAVGDVTAVAVARITITGTIVVNAAGTLTVQFAQNASNGTASSVLVNSSFNLIPIG